MMHMYTVHVHTHTGTQKHIYVLYCVDTHVALLKIGANSVERKSPFWISISP